MQNNIGLLINKSVGIASIITLICAVLSYYISPRVMYGIDIGGSGARNVGCYIIRDYVTGPFNEVSSQRKPINTLSEGSIKEDIKNNIAEIRNTGYSGLIYILGDANNLRDFTFKDSYIKQDTHSLKYAHLTINNVLKKQKGTSTRFMLIDISEKNTTISINNNLKSKQKLKFNPRLIEKYNDKLNSTKIIYKDIEKIIRDSCKKDLDLITNLARNNKIDNVYIKGGLPFAIWNDNHIFSTQDSINKKKYGYIHDNYISYIENLINKKMIDKLEYGRNPIYTKEQLAAGIAFIQIANDRIKHHKFFNIKLINGIKTPLPGYFQSIINKQ